MTPEQVLLAALNKLFWKCPIPYHIKEAALNEDEAQCDWALHWIGDLRSLRGDDLFQKVIWDLQDSEFKLQN